MNHSEKSFELKKHKEKSIYLQNLNNGGGGGGGGGEGLHVVWVPRKSGIRSPDYRTFHNIKCTKFNSYVVRI